MSTTTGRMEPHVEGVLGDLLVVDDGATHAAEVADLLAARGHRVSRVDDSRRAAHALDADRPHLLVLFGTAEPASAWPEGLCAAAARLGVPVLLILDDFAGMAPGLVERLATVDDWMTVGGVAAELPLRVARLLRRHGAGGAASPTALGPQFLPLIVHDLRTPLNVMGLSLRIIGQVIPHDDPDVQQDMRFLDENFHLLVRMLQQLSDYHRLFESRGGFDPVAFDPRRLADEVVEEYRSRTSQRAIQLVLEVDQSCPPEVVLDPHRARLALQNALNNAVAAANREQVVRLRVKGDAGRCVFEFIVDQPPPPTVSPIPLSASHFERIQGTEFERRGMDLAIAARVCELFDGQARLEVRDGKQTAIVLEWATQVARP